MHVKRDRENNIMQQPFRLSDGKSYLREDKLLFEVEVFMKKKKMKIKYYEKDESREVAGRLGRIYGLNGEAVDELEVLIGEHLRRLEEDEPPVRE